MEQGLHCPCCHAEEMQVFHEVFGVPTNSCILLETNESALAWPRGDIRLGFCPACGFISNVAFDARLTEYSGRYEETQAFSPTFNRFHEELARNLVARHNLKSKDIIEIGCGKGEFLALLCELGANRGLGFDPGYAETRMRSLESGQIEVVRDFFSDKYKNRDADFVACKMTLEHIHAPQQFLDTTVRLVRGSDGVAFIQVPESLRILRDCAFEDIYYEHCSYFTAGSLARLFESLGFEIVNTEITYGYQYLTVEAKRAAQTGPTRGQTRFDLPELAELVETFPARFNAKIQDWAQRLEKWRRLDSNVVIWGSGSKGVAFLASVPGAERVKYAVDINPYRSGYFMPGTGQRILAPEELPEFAPDVVIVMNRVYMPEIRAQLMQLGLQPDIHAL